MLYSMTGFGSASREVAGARYLVEIRSFNNKFLKAQIRLPEELQGLEADIESTVTARLRRGSVVVSVRFSDASPDAAARLNLAALQRCIDELRSLEGVTSIEEVDKVAGQG